jgi:hypothetical protein
VTPDELKRSEWSYVSPCGIVRDPPNIPRLLVKGVNGGDDFACGLVINGQMVKRLPSESWDDMLARVRRDMTLRGDQDSEAIVVYNPHVPPKPIRTIRPSRRGW